MRGSAVDGHRARWQNGVHIRHAHGWHIVKLRMTMIGNNTLKFH